MGSWWSPVGQFTSKKSPETPLHHHLPTKKGLTGKIYGAGQDARIGGSSDGTAAGVRSGEL
jgi:hypothetical protein